MNLIERKAKLEKIVVNHRAELGRLEAYREHLISEVNAFQGQIQLLDELIAEDPRVPQRPQDAASQEAPNDFESGAVEEE